MKTTLSNFTNTKLLRKSWVN